MNAAARRHMERERLKQLIEINTACGAGNPGRGRLLAGL